MDFVGNKARDAKAFCKNAFRNQKQKFELFGLDYRVILVGVFLFFFLHNNLLNALSNSILYRNGELILDEQMIFLSNTVLFLFHSTPLYALLVTVYLKKKIRIKDQASLSVDQKNDLARQLGHLILILAFLPIVYTYLMFFIESFLIPLVLGFWNREKILNIQFWIERDFIISDIQTLWSSLYFRSVFIFSSFTIALFAFTVFLKKRNYLFACCIVLSFYLLSEAFAALVVFNIWENFVDSQNPSGDYWWIEFYGFNMLASIPSWTVSIVTLYLWIKKKEWIRAGIIDTFLQTKEKG